MELKTNIICQPFYTDLNKTFLKGFVFTNKLNNKNLYFCINPLEELKLFEEDNISENGNHFFNNDMKPIKNIKNFFNSEDNIDYNLNNIKKLIEENHDKIEGKHLKSFYNLIMAIRDLYKNTNNFSTLIVKIVEKFNYKELDLIINNFNYPIDDYLKYLVEYNNRTLFVINHYYFLDKLIQIKNKNLYKEFLNFMTYLIDDYFKNIFENNERNYLLNRFNLPIQSILFTIESRGENIFFNKLFTNYLNKIINFKYKNYNSEIARNKIVESYYSNLIDFIENEEKDFSNKMDLIIDLFIKIDLISKISYFQTNTLIESLNLNMDEIIKNFNILLSIILLSYSDKNKLVFSDLIEKSISYEILKNYEKINGPNKNILLNLKDLNYNNGLLKDLYIESVYDSKIKVDCIIKILNIIDEYDRISLIAEIIKTRFNYKVEFASENLFYGKRDNILRYKSSDLEPINILYLIQMMLYSYDNPNDKYIVEVDVGRKTRMIDNFEEFFPNNRKEIKELTFLDFPFIRIYKYDDKLNTTKKIFDRDLYDLYYDLTYSHNKIKITHYNEIIDKDIFRVIFMFLSYYDLMTDDKEKNTIIFESLIK